MSPNVWPEACSCLARSNKARLVARRARREASAKWINTDAPPHRRRIALQPSSPLYFRDCLARRFPDRQGRAAAGIDRHNGWTAVIRRSMQWYKFYSR
jgi:hypothetical protein